MNNDINNSGSNNASELNSFTLGASNPVNANPVNGVVEQPLPNESLNSMVNNNVNPQINEEMNNVIQTPLNAEIESSLYQAKPIVEPVSSTTSLNVEQPVTSIETPIVSNVMDQMNAPVAEPVVPTEQPLPSDFGQVNNVFAQPAPMSDTLVEPVVNVIAPEKESVGGIPPKPGEKKQMNKPLFITLIVVLIFGVAFGIYYFLSLSFNKASINLKTVEYSIYDDISGDINSYATLSNLEVSNCTIDLSSVDNTTAGTYEYTVTCEETVAKANIVIVDNRDFGVEANDMVFFVNSEITADDLDLTCTKEECSYTIVDEETFNTNLETTGGPYELKVAAVDNVGNETEVTISYYVILAYFEAESEAELSDTYNVDYQIIDRLYIGESSKFMYIAYRYYTYDFSEDTETYTSLKEELEGTTEFDGLAGNLIFDDENYTITVEISLTTETLDIEYGSDFPEDYSSISSYYKSLGYSTSAILK